MQESHTFSLIEEVQRSFRASRKKACRETGGSRVQHVATAAATNFKQGIAKLLTIKLCDHISLPNEKTSGGEYQKWLYTCYIEGSLVRMKNRLILKTIEIGRRKQELKSAQG